MSGPDPRRDAGEVPAFRAIYIHVPFCRRVCAYCDFAVTPLREPEPRREIYLQALEREIVSLPSSIRPISVFFGGGTPSALRHDELATILRLLRSRIDCSRVREISIECNPEDLTDESSESFVALGFNRVSLGVQTLSRDGLRRLTRRHARDGAARAIRALRAAGVPHLSVDLILAWPGQTPSDLESDIDTLAEWGVDHVSSYVLTYEPGTPFTVARDRGVLRPASDSLELELLRTAFHRLAARGYARYEVSNFARPGHRCLHNQVYWRREPYLGLGPSAASFTGTQRFKNFPKLEDWANAQLAGASSRVEVELLSLEQSFLEFLMLSLRTTRGIRRRRLDEFLALDDRLLDRRRLEEYLHDGLLESSKNSIHATNRGIELADSLACGLAADDRAHRR